MIPIVFCGAKNKKEEKIPLRELGFYFTKAIPQSNLSR